MASYTRIDANQTVETLGGTATRDVMQIGVQTTGEGVYFGFRVPISAWRSGAWRTTAEGYAELVDTVAAHPNVGGMLYVQDVGAGGQLVDIIEITVVSDDGSSSAVLREPLGKVYPPYVDPIIDQTAAQLNEGLGG